MHIYIYIYISMLCIHIYRRSYFSGGNAWDLARCLLLMTLFHDRSNDVVNVLVIFVCWARLLDVFTSAEKVGRSFLIVDKTIKHNNTNNKPITSTTLQTIIYMYIYVYVCMYVCMYVCIYTYIYIYISIDISI